VVSCHQEDSAISCRPRGSDEILTQSCRKTHHLGPASTLVDHSFSGPNWLKFAAFRTDSGYFPGQGFPAFPLFSLDLKSRTNTNTLYLVGAQTERWDNFLSRLSVWAPRYQDFGLVRKYLLWYKISYLCYASTTLHPPDRNLFIRVLGCKPTRCSPIATPALSLQRHAQGTLWNLDH
jgi:hypothetical protein